MTLIKEMNSPNCLQPISPPNEGERGGGREREGGKERGRESRERKREIRREKEGGRR